MRTAAPITQLIIAAQILVAETTYHVIVIQ